MNYAMFQHHNRSRQQGGYIVDGLTSFHSPVSAPAARVEQSPVRGTYWAKEPIMAIEPRRQEPDIPPQKPDIQPEPRPEEIPQNNDFPEKEAPPMLL
jgi:hypothetical protein